MAETDVQSELTKIKPELKRLLQSSVAILEKVHGQNPTSWDQLMLMLKTAAQSSASPRFLESVLACYAALGINTNFQYKVSTESVTVKTSSVLHNPDPNPQVCVRTL